MWSWIRWIIQVSTRLNRFSFFRCWIWRTTKDFSAFTLNPKQQKITFVNVVLNILLILTYCLLAVFAPCFIYSLKFVFSHVCQTVKVTELTTVPFSETNHTCCATYFFYSTSWKKNLLYWFFYYKVSVWKLPINVKGEGKHPLKLPLHGSRCGKKKIVIK